MEAQTKGERLLNLFDLAAQDWSYQEDSGWDIEAIKESENEYAEARKALLDYILLLEGGLNGQNKV